MTAEQRIEARNRIESKMARNIRKLSKENLVLEEQLKRKHTKVQSLKEDLMEEQLTKQAKMAEYMDAFRKSMTAATTGRFVAVARATIA
jgi:predicted nuclease with TOPRIM domain